MVGFNVAQLFGRGQQLLTPAWMRDLNQRDRSLPDRFPEQVPDEVLPGNSMKPYGGLASAEDRSKLIAFLNCSSLLNFHM